MGSSDYSSDGGSEISDDDDSSVLYGGPDDTRLRCRKDMSVAQWDAARGTAEVVVKKGKAWTATGVTRGSQTLAFIEEIVFMVEQGLLVLLEGERSIPLLEAYSLVSSPSYGCSWDNYQVYSYLRKLGYIVGRHNVLWTLPKKRPPPQLESLTGQFADIKVSDDLLYSHTVASSSETDAKAPVKSDLKLMYDVYLPNASFKKSNPGFPAFSLCISSDSPPRRSQVRLLEQTIEGRPVKFASVTCDHVTIYSFDVVELPSLP